MTLLVVMGSCLVMLSIAATLGNHARQELKLSRAETGATQVQLLINSAFQAALSKAKADPAWPTPGEAAQDCTPVDPLGGSSYPRICTAVLEKQGSIETLYSVTTYDENGVPVPDYYEQIPVRVKSQVGAENPAQDTFGWVVFYQGSVGLQYFHYACTPNPDYPVANPEPCKQGG